MQDFQEVIVLQRLGLEFVNATDELEIQIPGLTSDLSRLELKELKIGINAADVGSNTDWITLHIKSPTGGLIPASGSKILTVPALEGGGTKLYRQYHHDNLILLKLNCKQATQTSRPIRLSILKPSGDRLAKDFVYLRMGLFEAGNFAPYMKPLDVDRFQAL